MMEFIIGCCPKRKQNNEILPPNHRAKIFAVTLASTPAQELNLRGYRYLESSKGIFKVSEKHLKRRKHRNIKIIRISRKSLRKKEIRRVSLPLKDTS